MADTERCTTEVVAALIWEKERFMICQRPANKKRGLLWEFAGGKVEPGETREEALVRECREELAVTVSVGDIFMEVTHTYPDMTVHLSLFHARITKGVPEKLEHNDIKWITANEIDDYPFCPADDAILLKLKKEMRKKLQNKLFKSILETDTAPIVVCDMDSIVVYMNPAAEKAYHKDLVGYSVKDCHNAESNQKIDKVLEWFRAGRDNNIIYTYHSEKENKDVYMVALRDDDGKLIGYYEKHTYRNTESRKPYAF